MVLVLLLLQEPEVPRLHGVKVLADTIDDVTTAEQILSSFCKPGATDAARAEAIWRAIVKYRHQTSPPQELLAADWEAHDPVKIFNVYGYCMCCCTSALISALNRLDGREARGRTLDGHSVAEVRTGDGWHMFDPSLINWFPRADGQAVSVDEIAAAVADWYGKNPEYRGNPAKIKELHRSEGWEGWRKGPELLARSPFYRGGFFPARTHGWNDTMIEYAAPPGHYEYGSQIGHRALLSLRPGESFVREAGNRGLHVNGDPAWDGLKARAPAEDLVFLKDFFPEYRGALVGNGVHRYAPDPATLPAGTAVIPMTSPYVYLGGRVTVRGPGVKLSLSTDNGRRYEPVELRDGKAELKILRRYAYRLKIERAGPIESLVIENDIQHSPRAMAWLRKGDTRITVASGADPGLATRTVNGRINADPGFNGNETAEGLGVTFENLELAHGGCWWKGGTGRVVVPVETDGPIEALRLSAQIRARGERDLIVTQASFDGGATWEEVARLAGPTPGVSRAFRFEKVPPGKTRALVRFELTGHNTIGIFNFRLDADYRDPRAGMRPFVVTHRWREGGVEKRFEQKVASLPASYTITTAAEPEMVSVEVGMPGAP